MPTATLVLPFAVPAEERVKAFTSSMELAVILFLTEAKRRKRKLLESTPKKTSFVSKLHYPLWAVPWENESLIIDGLGVFSYAITSQVLPDFTVFVDHIERGASVREQFRNALKEHEQTFKDFAKIDKVQINVFTTDSELLSAIFEYLKETSSLSLEANTALILMPPKLDEQTAIERAKQVSNLYKRGQSEIKGLEYAKNLLIETTKLHEQMILKEMESTREAYEVEISKFRPAVEKKVEMLLKERDARIAKMNRIMGNALRAKERERERRERELQRVELFRSEYLKRREGRRRKHDKIGVTRWEHRIRICENKIEGLKARVRSLSEFIEKTRRQNEADTEKLSYGYQVLIDQEKKKIVDIEVQRDRNVEAKQAEAESLRIAANRIAGQIEALSERKGKLEEELKKLAVPLQVENATLLCLPFYVACYKVGEKTRFQVFPPFRVVSSEGILKSVEKTIRSLRPESRVRLFLQPRSKALGKMLDYVFEEIKSDKNFRENLFRAAASANVMERQNFKETLTRGIDELEAEGWISQSQGDGLIKAYT